MASCGRKAKFPSAGAARASMRRMQVKGKVLGECQVYPCKVCGGWHWGRVRGTGNARGQQVINAIDRALAKDSAKRNQA